MSKPTAEDMARDLAADLKLCEQHSEEECPWEPRTFGFKATTGWPAAIRRAMAAEAQRDAALALLRRMVQEWSLKVPGLAHVPISVELLDRARKLLEGPHD